MDRRAAEVASETRELAGQLPVARAGVKAGVTGAVLDVKVKSGFGASSSDPPHRSVMARVL
jgi:hypothetical protein